MINAVTVKTKKCPLSVAPRPRVSYSSTTTHLLELAVCPALVWSSTLQPRCHSLSLSPATKRDLASLFAGLGDSEGTAICYAHYWQRRRASTVWRFVVALAKTRRLSAPLNCEPTTPSPPGGHFGYDGKERMRKSEKTKVEFLLLFNESTTFSLTAIVVLFVSICFVGRSMSRKNDWFCSIEIKG